MPKAAKEENGTIAAADLLRARVDELAVHLVLSESSAQQPVVLLQNIQTQAAAVGHHHIAGIAAETIDALAAAPDANACRAIVSVAVTRMQQSLVAAPGLPGEGALHPAATPEPVPTSQTPLCEDRELLGDFILESRDHLAQVEVQMITLEKEPEDAEAINSVFRAFHTIKGLAGFLDLADIREVAHETETLLDLARNQKLTITPAAVDLVLASADFLKLSLRRLEQVLAGSDADPAPEKDLLLQRIGNTVRGETHCPAPQAEALPCSAEPELPSGDRRNSAAAAWTGPERRSGIDRRGNNPETRSVKVDTAKLDYLVDMAGEMVIAQTMVRHHPELAALRNPALLNSLAQLARITGDLQKTAMSMRMVPIGGLFQRMNRLIRDLARKTGKQAEMEACGADTELDRNIVEELADPLMHMVRNAIDHGLENPQERRRSGKHPAGRIRLSARHQAGHIVIEIADDGQGLNHKKILDKARRTGLVDEQATLSEDEIAHLIFHPGFSTADTVTDVSGRGVGMDVVKKEIQKLRGQVEIQSVPGQGTTFSLRLPLTLAMIDGLVIGVGHERYVVPIFSVREMLRPTREMIFTLEGRQEMALVRDHLLPVVRLYRHFGVQPRTEEPSEGLLIVVEAAGRSVCLMADDLIGKQEVVIKSLGEMLKDVPGIAGGAILGDGRVGLILNVEGIFRGGAREDLQ